MGVGEGVVRWWADGVLGGSCGLLELFGFLVALAFYLISNE